ncbi:DUF927 domain-containing protein [Ideonella livida]|uniref:DUF927 domain-containing protein n=1 Tax=Ideonella livida TaxID=2707176 RepID=A0A7C9TIW5_9BURK|nr:DUF927 domain-containing protein [Ideonella livida]NDY90145.1 DUF927 domain-containing protein [Ideonella livida]
MPTKRTIPPPAPAPARQITPELVREALAAIPPDLDRETWVRLGMAVKSEFPDSVGFDLWDGWSQTGKAYSSTDAKDTWRSIKAGGRVTIGTLFGVAKDHGFRFSEVAGGPAVVDEAAQAQAQALAERQAQQRQRQREAEEAEYRRRADQAAREAVRLWDEAGGAGEPGQPEQASPQALAPYLVRKGVQAHGVRTLADGTVLVPVRNPAGELVNLQRIAPQRPTPEQEAKGAREKRFLPGGRKTGCFHLLGLECLPDAGHDVLVPVVLVAEGYATAASLYESTGLPVAVAWDAGNLVNVARTLRERLPAALLLLCADDDVDTEASTGKNPGRLGAEKAARAVLAEGAPAGVVLPVWPGQRPAGLTDFNDLASTAGPEAVRAQVLAAVAAPSLLPKVRRAAGQAATSASTDTPNDTRTSASPANDDTAPPSPQAAPWDDEDTPDDGEPPPTRRKPQKAAPAGAGGAGAGGAGAGGAGAGGARPKRQPHDPFTLLEDGVYFTARDGDGNEKPPRWLCAPLRVTARTRADDSNGWGCLLEFNDLDGNPKVWAMPSSLLSGEGAEWAARLRDMGLQMAPGTGARNLVAQYIDTRNPRQRVTCTDRVGWHPGGVFVLPSGCIGGPASADACTAGAGGEDAADDTDTAPIATTDTDTDTDPDTGTPRRYVFQSEAGMEDTFRQHGELADWQTRVAALAEGNSRLAFAIGCALAGPLLRAASLESGGFHFRGDSSKGKTTALKVAASVWGRPAYMQRWRTTDNALEATAVQHCDGTLILDEIGQVDGKVVGDCAYLLANEQEKGRNTRNGLNRKRRTWRLLFLSSGEKSLADHMAESGKRVMAGQEVRMVDIPLDAGAGMGGLEVLHGHDGPGALADAVTRAAARHYGTAGRTWLEWLAARHEALPGRLIGDGGMLERFKGQMVPEAASEQVRRVGTRFALVAAAGELATEAGILPWPAGHAASAARSCFNAWLAARGHLDNGEDAAMLRQVRAYLEKNGDALFTWTHRAMDDHRGNTPLRNGFKRMVNTEGEPLKFDAAVEYLESKTGPEWRDRTDALVEYLVLPEAFKRDMCKGFDSKAVAELLRARGHLRHEKDRLTIKHRLPGMDKAPVFHIRPSIFSDEL